MKQKVISYKKDGNSIKQSYMELEQMAAHVYVVNRASTRFGVELDLVFEVNGVYFRKEKAGKRKSGPCIRGGIPGCRPEIPER